MKKSKVFLLAAVGLLSVGVLTACSSSSKTSGKTYNYVYGGDPATLDYVSTNKKNMTTAVSNGVDGLFENDQYGNLKPSVAENWSVSQDGLTYTYKIRKGVKWYTSDGEEYANVTAKDFVTGLKHAADTNSEAIYLLQNSVKGLNDYLSGANKDFSNVGIKAVDDYADLLRISVASAGNDHRLGANEAPPAVVSIFLGDELTEVLKSIEKDEFFAGHGAVQMDIGAKVLPHFVKDNTDRNRTSPFAFTGNKFEFRMLGSSSSVANPNIILNTAVAESLRQFYEKLKDVPADEMESAVHELLKQTIIDHKRVIFNGNGYTDEWLEEAKKRGLYNLVSTPDALPHFIDEKNEKLLTSHHIFTDAELHSRYEIKMENYVKTLHIEANTLVEIIQKDLLPSITTYMEKLAQTASLKKSVVPGISVSAEASLLSRLTELAETMTKDLETLKADTAMAEYEVDKDLLKSAKLYQSVVLTDMEKVRVSADAAEALIPDSILPYPTYGKLLFSISD